jgi:fatty acid desaturase
MIESAAAQEGIATISDPSFQFCSPSNGPLKSNQYRELKKSIQAAGLFDRQYGYYARTALLSWTLLVLGFALLPWAGSHGVYLIDAVFLAFVFSQFGYLGHDGAHLEVFSEWRNNYIFCLIHGNFLLGMSTGWWTRKHNLHHSNPNCISLDGELEIAGLAFTPEIALHREGFMRAAAKYQAYTFFPLLALTIIALRVESALFLFRAKSRHALLEASLVVAHFILYGWFVFSVLGMKRGLLFILVHQVLFGLYMGLVFAPNHKGMPMLENGGEIDFLHKQVITARNVFPGRMTNYCYGGLNYQIEHHLFPSMPRCHLRKAREIIKPFCLAHSIPYAETGILQSYGEILKYLNDISIEVRKADRLATKPVQ